jgi:hypothetical protein
MKRLVWALVLCGCGTARQGGGAPSTGAGGNGGGSYMSVRSYGEPNDMRIDQDGRIFGSNFDLVVTPDGYRGLLGGALTMMSTDREGDRISGSRDGRIIDMHVEFDGVTIKATGLFAGRLGRLQVDGVAISSSVGRCGFDLTRQDGLHYVGQRGCPDGIVAPASLDLPPLFLRLSIPRKVMLLAAILYL